MKCLKFWSTENVLHGKRHVFKTFLFFNSTGEHKNHLRRDMSFLSYLRRIPLPRGGHLPLQMQTSKNRGEMKGFFFLWFTTIVWIPWASNWFNVYSLSTKTSLDDWGIALSIDNDFLFNIVESEERHCGFKRFSRQDWPSLPGSAEPWWLIKVQVCN